MTAADAYQAIGGKDGCHKLSNAFYARAGRDPILGPLFPGKSHRCAIEQFAAFLVQFLGGSGEDSQLRWWLSLRESHLRFKIGQPERDAWMANMALALDDAAIEEPLRGELRRFFERSSAYLVNQGHSTVQERTSAELEGRWDSQLALDEAAEAIRVGDARRAIALAETAQPSRPVLVGLIARIIRTSRHPDLLEYVRAKLTADPTLTGERYAGRTLLHEAAAAGSLTMVELLLRLGANPGALDSGGHTPLYSLSNECAVAGAAEVVRALLQAGADIGANGGVKRCTSLHMAARRGNVEIAAALLDNGADIESRDSLGVTPLRRAINCRQREVTALLVSRGALAP